MATVQNIIDRAMRLIGNLEPGTSATTAESNDAFTALNSLITTWRNESLMCYAMQDQSIPIIAGNSSVTIGPTGTLVTIRPADIETAYVAVGTLSYPVQVWSAEQFSGIAIKTQANSWPYVLWYAPTMNDGTIYIWPVANASSTLHVITRTPVLEFIALTDIIALPPGWENALAHNLAVMIAPEYERQANETVINMARETLKLLKRTNNVTPVVSFDGSLLGRYPRMNSTGNFYP